MTQKERFDVYYRVLNMAAAEANGRYADSRTTAEANAEQRARISDGEPVSGDALALTKAYGDDSREVWEPRRQIGVYATRAAYAIL